MSIIASGSLTPAEAPSQVSEADYDGATPFTGGSGPPATFQGRVRASVTATVVVVPFAGLGVAVWLAWGRGLNLADILLALFFYVITGLGVTIGFHRLLTHRSFTAVPALRAAPAVAGSMSFEGEVVADAKASRSGQPMVVSRVTSSSGSSPSSTAMTSVPTSVAAPPYMD